MAGRSAARLEVEQLDLFAEIEAAEEQRRFNEAPTLFDTGQRGYFARLVAAEQWAEEHGHFDCIRRSHAWRDHFGEARSGRQQPTPTCRPTSLSADLRCDHYDDGCLCVGTLVYRGACLCCQWEGPVREGENQAAEDAHDHAWPRWRELPIVAQVPESGTNAKQREAMARWINRVNDRYPHGWLESGGPIRTRRRGYGTRHVPNRTPFGGYDLCGEVLEDTP